MKVRGLIISQVLGVAVVSVAALACSGDVFNGSHQFTTADEAGSGGGDNSDSSGSGGSGALGGTANTAGTTMLAGAGGTPIVLPTKTWPARQANRMSIPIVQRRS